MHWHKLYATRCVKFRGGCRIFIWGDKLPGTLNYPIQNRKLGGFGPLCFKRTRIIKNKKNKNKKICQSQRAHARTEKTHPRPEGDHPRPERAHARPEKAHSRFEKAMSGLKRTILGLMVYLRHDRLISGLRRSFGSLRRSNLGQTSNLVHSSLRRVYPRPERINFRSENWSAPPLGMRKAYSCLRN